MNISDLRLRPPSRYQDPAELEWFVRFCQESGVRRYLEIGSRYGDSFYAVMANLPAPSFGMFIDLPESPEKARQLMDTAVELNAMGHDVRPFLGDSRDRFRFSDAKQNAPFDLILIDGDHTYEGVSADWTDYHWMAPLVALHDVGAPDDWRSDGKPNGVGRFWRELKELKTKIAVTGGAVIDEIPVFCETLEFITPSANMGYGIVRR